MTPHNRRGRSEPRSISADAKPRRGSEDVFSRIARYVKWFLSNTTRLVLTIGAFAGAVAAVIALLPKSADTFEASFTNVTAEPGVSLEHYDVELVGEGDRSLRRSRSSASMPVAVYRLAADIAAPPGLAGADAEAEGEPAEESSTTSTETTSAASEAPGETSSTSSSASNASTSGTLSSTSSTETASSSSPPPASATPIDGAQVAEGTGAPEAERHSVIRRLERTSLPSAKGCLSPCETRWLGGTHHSPNGLNAFIDHELVYHDPIMAAHALAARFASCRLKVEGHRQSPLGAMVTYNLTLSGFAGRWLTVLWSLESTTSGQQVPRCWWREVNAEQIKPTVDHRSFSGEFWVPMPNEPGDYRIHLVLTDREGSTEYVSKSSEPTIH